jgi:hypothetical protein
MEQQDKHYQLMVLETYLGQLQAVAEQDLANLC